MTNEMEKTLPIMTFEEEETEIFGLEDGPLDGVIKKGTAKVTDVSLNAVTKNIGKVINGVAKAFSSADSLNESIFSVDEVEINLNIGVGGEVSILSVCNADANITSSITVKLKRK